MCYKMIPLPFTPLKASTQIVGGGGSGVGYKIKKHLRQNWMSEWFKSHQNPPEKPYFTVVMNSGV